LYNAPQAYVDTQLYKVIRPHPDSDSAPSKDASNRTHRRYQDAGTLYRGQIPNVRALADLGGARTLVIVPMLKETN